jgi:PleD family two-component response regulator
MSALDPTPQPEATAAVVLLIDDQMIVAQAVRRLLAASPDITLECCQDPEQAVDHALRLKPTVILLDLVMPQIDGMTMLRFFKRHPVLKTVPVVMLSSKEEADGKASAFEG